MLKIDLAHHAWPLMFKRRWIHPRNCQHCVFLPVFIERCSSLKPSIFSEWPACSLLLKDLHSSADAFCSSRLCICSVCRADTCVLHRRRTWFPGWGSWWEVVVGGERWWWEGGGWGELSVDEALDLPRWQIAGNTFLVLLQRLLDSC